MSQQPPRPGEETDVIIEGHNYDGIQEYDNPMPGWWVWIFWATVVFAPIYFLGVHVFGFVNTYDKDLEASLIDLQNTRDAFSATQPVIAADEATLAGYVEDPAQATAGAATYGTFCASCHGAAGQGLIGPNLTDPYWIHGPTNVDLFNVITNGVVEKGMAPWSAVLSVEQRAQLVAYIRTLYGTDPASAKSPQGELYEEPAAAAPDA